MKYFVLTVLLIFITGTYTNVTAQYHPTLTNTKEWLVKSCGQGGCLHDYYFFSADTVIGGLNYKVLDGFHYNKNFFLREDVQQRQVFLAINTGSPVLSEYLLYDYGMKVGDSTYVQNPISPASALMGYYHLDSIVMKNYAGGPRKSFYLHGRDAQGGYHETQWIEGVGSTGLINTPGVMGDTVAMAELLCVTENTKQIYERKPNDTCYSNPVLSVVERIRSPRWDWYFAQESDELIFTHVPEQTVLEVFNLRGKLVLSHIITGQNRISIHKMSGGAYIARLSSEGRTSVKKIWKQ